MTEPEPSRRKVGRSFDSFSGVVSGLGCSSVSKRNENLRSLTRTGSSSSLKRLPSLAFASSSYRFSLIRIFHHHGDALPPANAQRGQTVAHVPALHLINQGGQDAGAAVAQSVAVGNGAAVDVHPLVEWASRRHAQRDEAAQGLGGEGFVELKKPTTHSNGTADTPERIVTLAKKAFDMSDSTLFGMAGRAFPILVHMDLGLDRKRRVTEIEEVLGCTNGVLQTQMLYEFEIADNVYEDEEEEVCLEVRGTFRHLAAISPQLVKRLLKKGATRAKMAPFVTVKGEENAGGDV